MFTGTLDVSLYSTEGRRGRGGEERVGKVAEGRRG